MKWYKGTLFSPFMGCHVIHAASKKEIRKMAMGLVQTDNAKIESLSITEHEVKNKKELIGWLNRHYNMDNG